MKHKVLFIGFCLIKLISPALANTCDVPEDYIYYADLEVNNGIAVLAGNEVITEDILVEGSLQLSGNAIISGNVVATGAVTVGPNSAITGAVYSVGEIDDKFDNIIGDVCPELQTFRSLCTIGVPKATLGEDGLNLCHNPPWPYGDGWVEYDYEFGQEDLYDHNVLVASYARGRGTPITINGSFVYGDTEIFELHHDSVITGGLYSYMGLTFLGDKPDLTWPYQEACECAIPPIVDYPNIVSDFCPKEGGSSLLVPLRIKVGPELADTFHGEILLQTSTIGTWSIGDGKGALTGSADSTTARYRFSESDRGQANLRFMPDPDSRDKLVINAEAIEVWRSEGAVASILNSCDTGGGIDLGGAIDALTCDIHSYPVSIFEGDTLDTNFTGVVKLSVSDNNGDWSVIKGNGSLTNVTAGSADYRFAASDNGYVELGLYHEQGGIVTITAEAPDIDSTATKQVHFRPYVIEMIPETRTGQDMCRRETNPPFPNVCISIANKQQQVNFTAKGKVQDSPNCQIIKEYSGVKNLNFWSTYLDPVNPAGRKVEVERQQIGQSESSSVVVPIEFFNGIAEPRINYPDAGKVQIHAYDATGVGVPVDGNTDELVGSTELYFNPYTIEAYGALGYSRDIDGGVMVVKNPFEAQGKEGAKFIRASRVADYDNIEVDTFDVSIRAVMDCTNDVMGHCDDDPITYSFRPNLQGMVSNKQFPPIGTTSVPEWKHDQTGQVTDYFYVEDTGPEYTFENISFPQVGSLAFSGRSPHYLTQHNDVGRGTYIYYEIGRFVPNFLKLKDFKATPACDDEFTYLNQKDITISYTLEAVAHGDNDYVLSNYTHSSGYLVAGEGVLPDSSDVYEDKLASNNGVNCKDRLLMDGEREFFNPENWKKGVYEVDDLIVGIAKEIQPDGPFLSNGNAIEYRMKLSGFDGEILRLEEEVDCPDDGYCLAGNLADIVYGRLIAKDGHGNENQPVTVNVDAEFLSEDGFIHFERDVCTELLMEDISTDPAKSSSNTIPIGSSSTTMTLPSSVLDSGRAAIHFSAPNRVGELEYFIDIS